MLRLVAYGIEGEPVRARVPRQLLGGHAELVDPLVSPGWCPATPCPGGRP